jgi:hypothetical protein
MSDLEIVFGNWKQGGRYGNHSVEVVTKDGGRLLAAVRAYTLTDKDWVEDATGQHVAAMMANAPQLMWAAVNLLNVLSGFTNAHPDEIDMDTCEAIRLAHAVLEGVGYPSQLLPSIPPYPWEAA